MNAALALARGPLLLFAFGIFFLGLLRQVGLTCTDLLAAYARAGDQRLPYRRLVLQSLGWIVPVRALRGSRLRYTAASMLFHLGMIFVPLFFHGHLELLKRGTGWAWPALDPGLVDGLTLATIAAATMLLLVRLSDRTMRFLSRAQDWLLPALCLVVFLSGYAAAHPSVSPVSFPLMYLTHLLSAELLLVLIPFTKLIHAALFPLTRLSWELGWHFVPGAGEKVRTALGKEGAPL